MPPAPLLVLDTRSIASGAKLAGNDLASQWENPSGIVSLLLIVAGSIVGQALEQLSGPSITPVVYSFGWVSYAVDAFVGALGLRQLLSSPSPTSPSFVIDLHTGRVHTNKSWLLEKTLKEFHYWKPREIEDAPEMDDHSGITGEKHHAAADTLHLDLAHRLTIAFFSASKVKVQGSPSLDFNWYSGIVIALVQLGIAAIPCGINGNWSVLLITGTGTILAFATGTLPQFGQEKWGNVRDCRKVVALTQGDLDQSSHCLVIDGQGSGLDLQRLAKGTQLQASTLESQQWKNSRHRTFTRVGTGVLALCWMAVLLMASGIRSNSWYLLGIGILGLAQNAIVAGSPRTPGARGLHLDYQGCIKARHAASALITAERKHNGLGKALLRAYYPELTQQERDQWWALTESPRTK